MEILQNHFRSDLNTKPQIRFTNLKNETLSAKNNLAPIQQNNKRVIDDFSCGAFTPLKIYRISFLLFIVATKNRAVFLRLVERQK